ncbi:Transcription elongation factor B polypeptide 3 [Eumeta japonica]|uniref:Transcription elongation factor B polypeptide 3 n=1 Tax=Eumeta variegata TaxID=151549 RepID=A0A4C1WEW2_EUMVA|nr:Transcription elongation factor B polypeptide 3 [Eumeta japonica]
MASVLDLIKHYQHGIEKNPNDEQRLGVTVQHLQDTGVGRTVNALRKEPGDVGTAAKALVNKWKLMVAAEESSEPEDNNHDTTKYNGQSGKDSDDNANQSRHGDNENESKYKTSSKSSNHRHTNGDYSNHKRKYHSSESTNADYYYDPHFAPLMSMIEMDVTASKYCRRRRAYGP